MSLTKFDAKGRVYIEKEIRKGFGERIFVFRAGNEIVIRPVPKDPLKHLQKLWREAGLNKYSARELKKMARKEAEREIVEELER